MKKYLSIHKIKFFVLAVILLLSSVLTSCGKITVEEVREKIAVNAYWEPPVSYNYGSSATPETYASYERIKTDKYTYRGVEYDVQKYTTWEFDDFNYERIYQVELPTSDGGFVYIRYIDEYSLPLMLICKGEKALYGDVIENPDEEDLIEVCEDFVDDFINEYASYKIDLSDYTLKSNTKTMGYPSLYFERYVNGIAVHGFRFDFNHNYQIKGYTMGSEPLPEDIYKRIPDFSAEEWLEIARPIICELYDNMYNTHDTIHFINDPTSTIRIPEEKGLYTTITAEFAGLSGNRGNFYIYYDTGLSAYCVGYFLNVDEEKTDGRINDIEFYCSYPIYTPEQED